MKRLTNTTTLTPDQFNDALRELGWRQVDFARRTGVTPGAVNRWASGKDIAPLWAVAYLGMAQDIAQLHARYLSPVKASKREDLFDDATDNDLTSIADLDALAARVNTTAKA